MKRGNLPAVKIALCCVLLAVCMTSVCLARAYDATRVPIMGKAVASQEQCLKYLLRVNPQPKLTVSPKKLVEHYYREAEREGVRPDIAFAQALQETGYFRYGGLVKPWQNNFCGLGSEGSHAKGARFQSPELGVRAHIQHILAYSAQRRPRMPVVDPRYEAVKSSKYFGRAATWSDLNGRWAIPGRDYGQRILKIYRGILTAK